MDGQKPTMTFYDIASGPPIHPYAPNPWKARYALNFTKTSYSTTWVPLPDVAATRKKLNVPAVRKHADGTDFDTLPVLTPPLTKHGRRSSPLTPSPSTAPSTRTSTPSLASTAAPNSQAPTCHSTPPPPPPRKPPWRGA
ncbi:MAG: hypothetical protein LQ346_006755 [Caloplaca aetnensis]|nr:MAG: hypothetical protein LQ346_006755 [Caloplaca aetnensis]